jgi:hypothetical protein
MVRFPAPTEDATPPSAPGLLTATGGAGSTALSWGAATDNVGVVRYDVFRSTTAGFTPSVANRVAQRTTTTYTDAGLTPAIYYYRVQAVDQAGNAGPYSNEANATVTGDTVAPTVSLTAPANGATVSATINVTASAADNTAVAGVQFRLDSGNLGAEDTTAPYSVAWDTTTATNASHTLTAIARDAAGNTTTATTVTVTVSNTSPPPVLLGNQLLETSVDLNAGGTAEAFRTTALAGGTLTKIAVYVDTTSAATSLVAGLYSDSPGHPKTLLSQGTLAAPVKGAWNVVTVPGAAVASGTTYWVAILSPNGTGTLRFRDRCCGRGTIAETHSATTLATLPAAWTTGSVYQDGPFSAYGQ